MIHQLPSPQLKTVRSPFSLPVSDSIGASFARPGAGSFEAITRSSQASAPAPVTSKREKPVISSSPTSLRTAAHSAATISKAFDRFSVGFSTKSGLGAK